MYTHHLQGLRRRFRYRQGRRSAYRPRQLTPALTDFDLWCDTDARSGRNGQRGAKNEDRGKEMAEWGAGRAK